jgi:outer membrane receptor protein involved in Fe transport
MKKFLLFIIILLTANIVLAQSTKISGTVSDSETKEGIPGANIIIKGKLTGTVTDASGNFELSTAVKPPFTIIISVVGYDKQELEVSSATSIAVSLVSSTEIMNEVVFSASRVEESILESPVSIEKLDNKSIRETPSINFYDGLQNLKGVEMVTSSLTYKQINARGFNSTGNARFLQLVDGVDNQTPGLNFAVGNLFGSSDLDMESAELIPGAASALYGPVAFNGVLMMRTKDPFLYQGLSAQAKIGVNHINEKYADPHGVYDIAVRYAKAFSNRFAFKINASYLTGLDWYATNYVDIDGQTPVGQRGDNNPARNALNIYGDEVARTLPGVGRVSRTGYEERELMDYDVNSLKINATLHYRITENMELIYGYNVGKGKASYTGSNRFSLNNFVLQQHRVELKGSDYFLRGYYVVENSHDSYNARALGQQINRTWVRDLNGNIVQPSQADNTWFSRYAAAYGGNVGGITAANHAAARLFADEGRYLPGSASFESEKERLVNIDGLSGAGVFSNSKFYHAEGQYDFSSLLKVLDVQAGGNFRMYDMFTNGTLFDDKAQKITIKEGGVFLQVSKRLINDRLKLTASNRYDKNENFKGRMTPRASAVVKLGKTHHFRTSFQTGFRNPTPVDQYIKLNAGPITILGGVPNNSKGMDVYENSFTASSVGAFGGAFGAAVGSGTPPNEALMNNKQLLQKSNVGYIKPERIETFEIGYKSLLFNKLLIDANYYTSSYTDFILNTVVIKPQNEVLLPDGSINPAAAGDVLNGNVQAYQLYTNAADEVAAQGATLGLTYLFFKGYSLSANGTWSSFDIKDANPNNVPAFNTPTYRTAVTFGNSEVTKNFGFNVAWRWQDAFDWVGSFAELRPGRIDAYSIFDAQVSYKVPAIKSVVKVGGNNVFNKQVYQAYGSPSIGALYYVSVTFDQFLR